MASIAVDRNGSRRIQFIGPDRRRHAVRVGKIPQKNAEYIRGKIEYLLTARFSRSPLDPETARWLAEIPAKLHQRLVNVGLAEPRADTAQVTLGELCDRFIRGQDSKHATLVRIEQATRQLLDFFGQRKRLSSITEADAEEWRAKMKADKYAAATISRTVRYARQLFHWAIRRKLTTTNPFSELKAGPQNNPARTCFVSQEDIQKVIDAAPDDQWRLLVALGRYAGLRVPSEALALRWTDVNWEHNRLLIRSPKTEHHEGKGERLVPIFPELRPHLQATFDAAPEGAEYVISRYRSGANLNTHLRRLIERAGLKPWPRAWHNLRSSRQTELATQYPLHTACSWMGNSKLIASGHYLQVTDADWQRAIGGQPLGKQAKTASGGPEMDGAQSGARTVQNHAQQPSVAFGNDLQVSSETAAIEALLRVLAGNHENSQDHLVGRAGLEPATLAFSMRCSTN
jgi:integrase